MKARLFFTILLAAATAFTLQAQPQQSVSVIHDIHRIASTNLGEDRTILVRVPVSYRNGSLKYPVVYMLDAHPPHNAMMAGMLEQQAWGGQMSEVILVGIQNTNRTRDLTPTRSANSPGSGGGDKFLDYIEKEVIPLVEKHYRVQPYRIIAGHSLGGLFVTYTMLTRPELFNGYIAASPVLHWDDNLLIKRGQAVFAQKRDWDKTYFAAIGDEPDYQRAFDSFRELIKKASPRDLSVEFQTYPTENHGSVVLPAYYAGLRKIFAGWQPPARATVAEIESHYRRLTDRFGFAIPVPEELMNRAGYELMNAGRMDEAIEVFRKNVRNYPDSANTYDSLGEAYETAKQLKNALENYTKAYDMAVRAGDTQRAAIYKTNRDRAAAKQ